MWSSDESTLSQTFCRTKIKQANKQSILSRTLLKKPVGTQLAKKFPEFYESRKSITLFAFPYPESNYSSPQPHIPISSSHILILSCRLLLGFSKCFFLSFGFSHQTVLFLTHTCLILIISGEEHKAWSFWICSLLQYLSFRFLLSVHWSRTQNVNSIKICRF